MAHWDGSGEMGFVIVLLIDVCCILVQKII